MSVIQFGGFQGENRAIQAMLIPESVGVVSTNQKPGRGDLRPWNAPLNKATVPAGRQTIHRMGRDVASDTNYWLSWPSAVHVVVAGNAADTDERTYYSGDGAPKWTDTTKALVSAPYPTSYRALGIAAPIQPPTLSLTPPAAVSVTALVPGSGYSIAVVGSTDWVAIGLTNPTVAATSITIGQTYRITFAGSTDFTLVGAANSTVGTTFTATAVGTGTGTAVLVAAVGQTFTASTPGTGTGTATPYSDVTELRYYTYTFVSDIGEESSPCVSPTAIQCTPVDTINISGMSTSPGAGVTLTRIYRTQTGNTSGGYYFVAEQSALLSTYSDSVRTLGEPMATTTWLPPPSNLTHLIGLWNGMMAGISGRSIRFCEAGVPYAWPIAYEVIPSNTQPVALATFGQTLVVLTNGNPSVITGSSPDSLDEAPMDFDQACVSAASAVGMRTGVAWASPDGLAYLGSGGPQLLTQGTMTRDDWQALHPETIHGYIYEGRYFGFYNDGAGRKGFVLDMANPNGIYFLDFGCDAAYSDQLFDGLYALDGVNVQRWDAGTPKTVTFRSKIFRQPKPVTTFACAQVVGDQTVGLPATFKLYVDGVLKHTCSVVDTNGFRLPSGFYGNNFQVEVSATTAIQIVMMAHSMQELAKV